MTTPVFQRETVEYVFASVTLNGYPITTGVQLCAVPDGSRPVTWVNPDTVVSGQLGLLISSLAPDRYRMFAKVTASPEIPVEDCGTFIIN
jgi:hypothetical protein